MQRINSLASNTESALERLLSSGTETDLTISSERSLTLSEKKELLGMMGRIAVNYGTQAIPDGWPEEMRSHWTQLTARHGTQVLREAIERHMDTSHFLPKRSDINAQVAVILERKDSVRQADSARKHLNEVARWRETWERERAEERAAKEAGVAA